jgi:hypothetical protein
VLQASPNRTGTEDVLRLGDPHVDSMPDHRPVCSPTPTVSVPGTAE